MAVIPFLSFSSLSGRKCKLARICCARPDVQVSLQSVLMLAVRQKMSLCPEKLAQGSSEACERSTKTLTSLDGLLCPSRRLGPVNLAASRLQVAEGMSHGHPCEVNRLLCMPNGTVPDLSLIVHNVVQRCTTRLAARWPCKQC